MGGPYVFNIQRFSVNDGPGMRTTIFFKGCPLRCAWCHNPESQRFEPEIMTTAAGVDEVVGQAYTVAELVEECAKDILFYDQSGGGVTLSGGEVLAQDIDYVVGLCRGLQARGISVGIDTCGVAARDYVARVAEVADFFLYDLKFLDEAQHREWTGASNKLVLANLEALAGLDVDIYLRLLLIEGLNTDHDTMESLMLWLKVHRIPVKQVNLLPYHRFGIDKYARLGRPATEFAAPDDATVADLRRQITRFYTDVTIGG
jgi:pyruvate formate lyase activating enzyme